MTRSLKIGNQEIIEALEQIALCVGVHGNMDMGDWANPLPEKETIKVGKILLCVIHNIYNIELSD